MSKDRLEQFIQDNRDDFDSEIPSLNLWGDIEKEINPQPKKSTRQIATRATAAAIALLIVASCWIMFTNGNTQEQHANLNLSPNALLVENNPELAEISEYYSKKINKNKGRLAAMHHHDPDLYRELNLMESAYDTLKIEWERNPHKSDERLVNAMITNYRTRAMLLENVVDRLEGNTDNSFTSARPAVFREW